VSAVEDLGLGKNRVNLSQIGKRLRMIKRGIQTIFKSGDVVHVVLEMSRKRRTGKKTIKTTTTDRIMYFQACSVFLERLGFVHFNKVFFYSCGYHVDGRVFILKKRYHYYIALCIEFIRLSLYKIDSYRLQLLRLVGKS